MSSTLRRDVRMFLSRALNRSLAPPDWVSVNLTLRCNLSCAMCTTCYDVPDELSTAEVMDIIDQTALWGVKVFNPLGGEPFLRGDLEAILEHACRKDFYITLTTNGTLINRRRAEMIAGIPVAKLHFNISLDGPESIHDGIRGEGMFQRAITGYRRIREADTAAGNERRKVLVNAILHRKNLPVFEQFLDSLAAEGFDGVQILNLFRHGKGPPEDPGDLWIRPDQIEVLRALVERLQDRVRNQGGGGFRILNSEEDLGLIPTYYVEELRPLQAPCWSGWKELYINADGTAIMCDGKLDFLNGTFGSARKQTLRQLWDSPELHARREVVKQCQTPCIQNCYLRRSSDSPVELGERAVAGLVDRLRARTRGLARRVNRIDGGELTLELADAAPWAAPWDPGTARRFDELVERSPVPIAEVWRAPARWNELRDRRYVDFGRGFLGFEVVRSVVEDLRANSLVFPDISLAWRGEPLLHPEIDVVLRYLLAQIRDEGVAEGLTVRTDGRLLHEGLVSLLAEFPEIPQTWILHGNGVDPCEEQVLANVDALLARRGPALRVVASWVVIDDWDPHRFVETWRPRLRSPWMSAGRLLPSGDGLWFRRSDHEHFQATADARARLRDVAEILDISEVDLGEEHSPPRCPGASATPVVSWDGKLTLCPRDVGLRNRVGEVTGDRLSRIWLRDPHLARQREIARSKGVPGLPLCQDCHFVWSPNYRRPTSGTETR